MARLNVAARKPQLPPQAVAPIYPSNIARTHQGAPAADIPAELQLRRAVCSCLLWEDTFYESGQDIGDRITDLAGRVPAKVLADLAYDARQHFHLRHVPLVLLSVLARTGSGSRLVSDTIADTIARADEIMEFLAVYARINGVEPQSVRTKLSAQVKKGLARVFQKFDQYQLAKYNRDGFIRSRDVAFMAHVPSGDQERGRLMARLVNKSFFPEATKSSGFRVREQYGLTEFEEPKLTAPETWEVALSAGKDKRETFEQMLRAGKLGYLALLRNLRNMTEAGVDGALIANAIIARRGARRVLPFRYVSAARACPQMTAPLDKALQQAVLDLPVLPGRTTVLVDVSSSMDAPISAQSQLNRIDVAATLAAIVPGDCQVFSFSHQVAAVGQSRGLSGIEAIKTSQQHGGTYLGQAVDFVNRVAATRGGEHDRLIVLTDEQSSDHVPAPKAAKAYMINVASYRNGVGYGDGWTHIDGFSEQTLRFIAEFEKILN